MLTSARTEYQIIITVYSVAQLLCFSLQINGWYEILQWYESSIADIIIAQ
jgi:hypothetical protein